MVCGSAQPTGPFRKAVRVVTHNKQTFYNVCHHGFMDREDGKLIHFEGTYTNEFSGNPERTPRYNYNQVLYRLDLSSEGAARRDDVHALSYEWLKRVHLRFALGLCCEFARQVFRRRDFAIFLQQLDNPPHNVFTPVRQFARFA